MTIMNACSAPILPLPLLLFFSFLTLPLSVPLAIQITEVADDVAIVDVGFISNAPNKTISLPP